MIVRFLISKINIILAGFVFLFLTGYVLFSSLSTALGFKMENLAQRQEEAREVYEANLSVLTQARNKDSLLKLSLDLGLTAITLADGYVDIRPAGFGAAGNLANRQQ